MPNKSVAFFFWMNNKSVAVITTLVEASYETWVKLSKQKNISFLCKACRKASDWQRKRKVDGGVGGTLEVVTISSAVSNTSSIGNLGEGEDTKSSGIWLYLFNFFFFSWNSYIYIYIYIYLTYRTEFIYLLVHFAPRFYKIK